MMSILVSVTLAQFLIVIIAILNYSLSKRLKTIVSRVYKQPNQFYYFKFIFFYVLLLIRRLKFLLNGKERYFPVNKLEKLQPLSIHENAFDAVFFQAVSQDGFYLCGGTERRQLAKINGLFYILTPKYGLLLSEKLPQTLLDADPASVLHKNEYSTGNIKFTPVEPMKKWLIVYDGCMRSQRDPKQIYNVKLEAEWISDLPWFLFETDLPVSVLAKALAKEKLSKKLFKALKSAHQTHYEQMGSLKATLTVNEEQCMLKMDSFRDHSFGHKRDWSLMHRYIFHMLYLSDDTKICVGVISQPCTTSHIEMGYVVNSDKQIEPITNCSLQLYQHGELGIPPKELSFIISTNSKDYEIQVKYISEAIHYLGKNNCAKMFERFVECTVNGIEGKGISEWHYKNLNYKEN